MSKYPTTEKAARALLDELEGLIDRNGLDVVMELVASICQEKAEHIRTNWQDGAASYFWDKAAEKIEKHRTTWEDCL